MSMTQWFSHLINKRSSIVMDKNHTLYHLMSGLTTSEPRLTDDERTHMWAAITRQAHRDTHRRQLLWAVAAVVLVLLILTPFYFFHHRRGADLEQMLAEVSTRPVHTATVFTAKGSVEVPSKSVVSLDVAEGKLSVSHNGSVMAVDAGDADGLVAFAVPAHARLEVVLADGSHITLREHSTLVVPFDIRKADIRQVALQGEAYLAVHHEEQHPFVAMAGDLRVGVLGTKFLVAADKGRAQETVTLLEGAVAVKNDRGGTTMLSPGQTFVYDKATARNTIRQERDAQSLALWKDDLLSIDGASLTSVLQKIETAYGIRIRYNRQLTDTIYLGGRLDTSVGIGQVLQRLETIAPIRVVHSGDHYEVQGR